MNFKISLSLVSFDREVNWDSDGDCLESVDHFDHFGSFLGCTVSLKKVSEVLTPSTCVSDHIWK